jgi:hypothetical protein
MTANDLRPSASPLHLVKTNDQSRPCHHTTTSILLYLRTFESCDLDVEFCQTLVRDREQ